MHALLLAAALVLAQDDAPEAPRAPGEPTHGLKVLGFTRDHRFLVYSGYSGGEEEAQEVTVVRDLLLGSSVLLNADDAAKYLTQHPVDPAAASRTSPDGKSIAEVRVDANDTGGSWMNGAWTSEKTSTWNLSVTRAGKTSTAATAAPADAVEVYWSPDGRYTLWLSRIESRGMRDVGSEDLRIGTDGRPSVAVVMDKAKLKESGLKIASLLDQAGFAVLATTAAQKSRPKSVVFARGGLDADAKALAARLPGGATVEPLTWAATTDLVVYFAGGAGK